MCMALVQSEETKNLAENFCHKFVNNGRYFWEIPKQLLEVFFLGIIVSRLVLTYFCSLLCRKVIIETDCYVSSCHHTYILHICIHSSLQHLVMMACLCSVSPAQKVQV